MRIDTGIDDSMASVEEYVCMGCGEVIVNTKYDNMGTSMIYKRLCMHCRGYREPEPDESLLRSEPLDPDGDSYERDWVRTQRDPTYKSKYFRD